MLMAPITIKKEWLPSDKVFEAYSLLDGKDSSVWSEGLKRLKDLVETGNAHAASYLGFVYQEGIGVTQDFEVAEKYYLQSFHLASSAEVSLWLSTRYYYAISGSETPNNKLLLEWLQSIADQGSPDGCYNLGLLYLEGRLVEKNASKAIHYFQCAVKQNHVPAKLVLAYCIFTGDGVEISEVQSRKLCKQVIQPAENDVVWTIMNSCGRFGWGFKQDAQKKFRWYQIAANQGHAEAINVVGEMYRNGEGVDQDCSKAFNHFQKASNAGCLLALVNWGTSFELGIGCQKNSGEAFDRYLQAAKQKFPSGVYHVARCYKEGIGVESDPQKAFQWYLRAARKDFPEAFLEVAYCYDHGRGVKSDWRRAAKWYRRSALSVNEIAATCLGEMYLKGEGVERNPSKALYWLHKASSWGDSDAQTTLGVLYFEGEIVEQDLAKAIRYYRRAARCGHTKAAYNLGLCRLNGEGMDYSPHKAAGWFRKAVKGGHGQAAFQLGEMYEEGEGPTFPMDREKAKKWYRIADARGVEDAKLRLHALEWK